MATEKWEKRICQLIKRLKSSSDEASFRNDFHDAVTRAIDQGKLTGTDADLLFEARSYLEGWTTSPAPDPLVAASQWMKIYEAGQNRIPETILEALLRRFPESPLNAEQLRTFVLQCSHPSLIEVLLDRRLVRSQHLNELTQTHPAEFYQSAAFDVMTERHALQGAGPLWEECARGKARPDGLMTRERAIVSVYASFPEDDGNERLVALLLAGAVNADGVLGALLNVEQAALRFCRYIAFGRSHESIEQISLNWIGRCQVEFQKGLGQKSQTVWLVLAMLRLSCLVQFEDRKRLTEQTAALSQHSILQVLQKMEEDCTSGVGDVPLVVLAKELHEAVQEHVRRLPTGTSRADDSPERALRFERYRGSKEVIEQILHAMEAPIEASALRDALEVSLFNCGVRPLGEAGEQVHFDVNVHEAETSAVLVGDAVVISHVGRSLGEGQERLVLRKAKVRPVRNHTECPGEN